VLRGEPERSLHEYEHVLNERAARRRLQHIADLPDNDLPALLRDETHNPLAGNCDPARAVVVEDLIATCDALVRGTAKVGRAHARYEPHLVAGTHAISKEQKLALAYAGYVIGQTKRYLPATGFIVPVGSKPRLVRLLPLYSSIRTIVASLRQLVNEPANEPPPLALTRNCATCPFHDHCLLRQARLSISAIG